MRNPLNYIFDGFAWFFKQVERFGAYAIVAFLLEILWICPLAIGYKTPIWMQLVSAFGSLFVAFSFRSWLIQDKRESARDQFMEFVSSIVVGVVSMWLIFFGIVVISGTEL